MGVITAIRAHTPRSKFVCLATANESNRTVIEGCDMFNDKASVDLSWSMNFSICWTFKVSCLYVQQSI